MKKTEAVKRDHEKRVTKLKKTQEEDQEKAQLIEVNTDLVERACLVIQSAIASGMTWTDIEAVVRDARERGDSVAQRIHKLKLKEGLMTLLLNDPFAEQEDLVGIQLSVHAVKLTCCLLSP